MDVGRATKMLTAATNEARASLQYKQIVKFEPQLWLSYLTSKFARSFVKLCLVPKHWVELLVKCISLHHQLASGCGKPRVICVRMRRCVRTGVGGAGPASVMLH